MTRCVIILYDICLQTGFRCLVSIIPIDTGTTAQRTTTNKRGLSTKVKCQSTQTINNIWPHPCPFPASEDGCDYTVCHITLHTCTALI